MERSQRRRLSVFFRWSFAAESEAEANRSFSPHKCYSVKLSRKHLAVESLAFTI